MLLSAHLRADPKKIFQRLKPVHSFIVINEVLSPATWRTAMFELYLTCPATGAPIYAGFHSQVNEQVASGVFLENAVCPACGGTHDWHAVGDWSAIPVVLASQEAPPLVVASSEEVAPNEEELPKVA
jgi:hypothetical protein